MPGKRGKIVKFAKIYQNFDFFLDFGYENESKWCQSVFFLVGVGSGFQNLFTELKNIDLNRNYTRISETFCIRK